MNFIHDKRHKKEKGKGRAHPVFLFLINKMEQIGQYDHSNNYSKKDGYKVSDTQPFGASQSLSTAECIS